MKSKIIFILIFGLLFSHSHGLTQVSKIDTVRSNFIRKLVNEFEEQGRYIFVRIDTCYADKKSYEVVSLKNVFFSTMATNKKIDKKLFIWMTVESLLQHEAFTRCYDDLPPEIRGVEIDMKVYKKLNKRPIRDILKKYFQSNKELKKKFEHLVYELIAVCYTKNIAVISPNNGKAYYKFFPN